MADLARRFFACNPFYLSSAGVLLWGLNRLSAEPRLAGAESSQILINFSALFAYEILLVLTAIFLARRAIWEDALVLVGLENLFVMIPFSLVSRAVLINQPLAQEMCVAAAVLAVAKFWALKRFLPQLNLSGRLLGLGAAVLAFNIAIALFLQRLANDRPALHGWLTWVWLVAFPILLGLIAFLPQIRPSGKSLPQRAWLPHAIIGLWLVVTGFHLFGVGYVHVFPWRNALLAPACLVLAWVTLLQSQSANVRLHASLRRVLFCSPFAAPFLALADLPVFSTLHAINLIAYSLLWWRQRLAQPALVLATLSFTTAVAGIPEPWLARFTIGRIEWVAAISALAALLPILRSRDPRLGLVGAISCAILAGLPTLPAELSLFWPAHAGIVFLLIHSLRWDDHKFVAAASVRHTFGMLWGVLAFVWLRSGDASAATGCVLTGALVLVSYAAALVLTRRWPPPSVAWYAGLVTGLPPGLNFAGTMREIPPAYLAILGSIPLFVAGTILALSRHRWQRKDSPDSETAFESNAR